MNRSATATGGRSPPPSPTAHSSRPTSADTAPSPSPPTTPASMSGWATRRPSTATKATPSMSPTSSSPAPPPTAACTSAPPEDATPTTSSSSPTPPTPPGSRRPRAGPRQRPGRRPRCRPTPPPRHPHPAFAARPGRRSRTGSNRSSAQLVERRDDLQHRLNQAANDAAEPPLDLEALQPDLTAARAAWQPYASPAQRPRRAAPGTVATGVVGGRARRLTGRCRPPSGRPPSPRRRSSRRR